MSKLIIEKLKKIETDPPIWVATVAGHEVQLSTQDLLSYRRFARACMGLGVVFDSLSQSEWTEMLEDVLLHKLEIVAYDESKEPPDPRDTLLLEYLEEFFEDSSDRKEDLLDGRPWESVEDGRYYFTLRSFDKFLRQERVNDAERRNIYQRIVRMGGGKHFFNFGDRGVRTLFVPSHRIERPQTTSLNTEKANTDGTD